MPARGPPCRCRRRCCGARQRLWPPPRWPSSAASACWHACSATRWMQRPGFWAPPLRLLQALLAPGLQPAVAAADPAAAGVHPGRPRLLRRWPLPPALSSPAPQVRPCWRRQQAAALQLPYQLSSGTAVLPLGLQALPPVQLPPTPQRLLHLIGGGGLPRLPVLCMRVVPLQLLGLASRYQEQLLRVAA